MPCTAVLRKALAKDRENRYASCAELIAEAAAALGLEIPGAGPRPIVPESLHRRAPAFLVVGGLVLAAAVGLAVLTMTGGDDGDAEPLGDGVAALDPATGDVGSFVDSATPPGRTGAVATPPVPKVGSSLPSGVALMTTGVTTSAASRL